MELDEQFNYLIENGICTEDEMKTVCDFHNDSDLMKGILIRREVE